MPFSSKAISLRSPALLSAYLSISGSETGGGRSANGSPTPPWKGSPQSLEQWLLCRLISFRNSWSNTTFSTCRGQEWPKMFRMPAYDPVAIAIMGFGILLAAALAFALGP